MKKPILITILSFVFMFTVFMCVNLYNTNNSWNQYSETMRIEFSNALIQFGYPEDKSEEVSGCLADAIIEVLNSTNCPIPSIEEDLFYTIERCISNNENAMLPFMEASIRCNKQQTNQPSISAP